MARLSQQYNLDIDNLTSIRDRNIPKDITGWFDVTGYGGCVLFINNIRSLPSIS